MQKERAEVEFHEDLREAIILMAAAFLVNYFPLLAEPEVILLNRNQILPSRCAVVNLGGGLREINRVPLYQAVIHLELEQGARALPPILWVLDEVEPDKRRDQVSVEGKTTHRRRMRCPIRRREAPWDPS